MYEIQEAYDEFYDIVENNRMYTEAGADVNKQRRAKIALAIVVIGGVIIAIAAIIRHIKKEKEKKSEELLKTLTSVNEESIKIKDELRKYKDKIEDGKTLTDSEWSDADELCKKTKAINNQ